MSQHRESWQNIGALLTSKAELSSFALELSKKMGMRYVPPAMPVNIAMKQDRDSVGEMQASSPLVAEEESHTSVDIDSITAMFGKK